MGVFDSLLVIVGSPDLNSHCRPQQKGFHLKLMTLNAKQALHAD